MPKKMKVVITKGRKKMAMARARVKKGLSSIKINGKSLDVIEPKLARLVIEEPLIIAKELLGEKVLDSLDIDVNVSGGGVMGQAYAVRTAIGKALVQWTGSEDLKKKYLEYDRTIIIDDVRVKEPKKYLRKGARAKPTKSYR